MERVKGEQCVDIYSWYFVTMNVCYYVYINVDSAGE